MAWRYLAQRALTGEIIEWDLPINVSELSWALSGAGSLRGTIAPDAGQLRAADGRLVLEEWGTFIFAEADGEIRWGGIVISSSFEGETWNVEAAGFSTYPHGTPFLGSFSSNSIDPHDVVAVIWAHIQGYATGNLGVRIERTRTPHRVGTPAEPYKLHWADTKDCGSEIDSLARETPFDYIESHYWNQETGGIMHDITLYYPRVGRRRNDLVFVQGDNVTSVVSYSRGGDDFANEIVGLGLGEGEAALRRSTAVNDGKLRRSYVYAAKDVSDAARLDGLIRDEPARRRGDLEISSIDVIDHPNANIGTWSLGDDILVSALVPWIGEVDVWCRITGWSLTGESTATISLSRSDTFAYGG